MKEPKWLIGVALCAATLAVFLHWNTDGRLGSDGWSAVSAMATTIAVVVALGIPLWQERVRRADLVRDRVRRDWIAADELLELNREAYRYYKDLLLALGHPTDNRIQFLIARCERAKEQLVSLSGRRLFDRHSDLLRKADAIATDVAAAPDSMKAQWAAGLTKSWLLDANLARAQSREWVRRVLSEAKTHNVDVPPLDTESASPFVDSTRS